VDKRNGIGEGVVRVAVVVVVVVVVVDVIIVATLHVGAVKRQRGARRVCSGGDGWWAWRGGRRRRK